VSTLTSLEPLPQTRRGWIALVVTAVLFVVSFVTVVRFYDAEGGSRIDGGLQASSGDGIIVTVEPVSVDATRSTADVHLGFGVQGDRFVGDDGRLLENVRVTVSTTDGVDEIRFPAGTALNERVVTVSLDGEVASYPFDSHTGYALLYADTYERSGDGSLTSTSVVPMGIQGGGGVNGWDTVLTLPTSFDDNVALSIEFSRAFSTKVFALLIVVIAGILALLALSTAALVQADRRPAEAALLGWTAALLFALPLLRTYLPNGPPFGASIDMYAYLWFTLAAGAASVLVVVGWNGQRLAERRRADRQRAEHSREAGHAS